MYDVIVAMVLIFAVIYPLSRWFNRQADKYGVEELSLEESGPPEVSVGDFDLDFTTLRNRD